MLWIKAKLHFLKYILFDTADCSYLRPTKDFLVSWLMSNSRFPVLGLKSNLKISLNLCRKLKMLTATKFFDAMRGFCFFSLIEPWLCVCFICNITLWLVDFKSNLPHFLRQWTLWFFCNLPPVRFKQLTSRIGSKHFATVV